MRVWLVVMAVALASRGLALAADPRYPDWPCNQIKVPEMSVAAVWAGPPIDDVESVWEQDPAIRNLVAQLAARRTPLEDAQKMIADVITGDAAERQRKAKVIFAGLFKALNQERGEVMNVIERFSRKQREFADDPSASGVAEHARSRPDQTRRTGQPRRMGYAHFRRAEQDHRLCLRGAGPDRTTIVCARARDPAIARIESSAGLRRRSRLAERKSGVLPAVGAVGIPGDVGIAPRNRPLGHVP